MAECNWDPKKHGGRPCPKHGSGGLWDENVLSRKSKLKEAGYEDADLEDEDLKEDFDDDFEEEFGEEWTDEKIGETVADEEYVYADIDDKDHFVELLNERNGVPFEKAQAWVDKHWEEHQQHYQEDEDKENDSAYDFDKWSKETNSPKEQHVGYIDTNKSYKPEEIMKIVSSEDDWDVIAGSGFEDGNVWFKHKSGPHYVWNRGNGKIKLLSKNAMNRYEGFEDEDNLMFDKNDTEEQHIEKRKKLLGY